jgi:hypothetical protein
MKLADILILSIAIVFLIIGIDQVMKNGIADAYWAFMLALVLFFVFNLRRRKTQ